MDLYIYKNTGITKSDTILFENERERDIHLTKNGYRKVMASTPFNSNRFIVEMNYDVAMEYDYVRYDRMTSDGTYRPIFSFINDIEQVSDDKVILNTEIDTITTFMFDDLIGSMFIEREHMEKPNNTYEDVNVQEYRDLTTRLVPQWYDELHTGVIPFVITVKKQNKDTDLSQPSVVPYSLDFYMTYLSWDYQERVYGDVWHKDIDETGWHELLNIKDLVKLSSDDKVVDIAMLPFMFDQAIVKKTEQRYTIMYDMLEKGKDYDYVSKIGDTDFGNKKAIKMINTWRYPVLLKETDEIKFDDYDPKIFKSSQFVDKILKYADITQEYDVFYFDDNDKRFQAQIGYGATTSIAFYPHKYGLRGFSATTNMAHTIPLITNDYINFIKNEKFSRNTAMIGGVASAIINTGVGVATGGMGLATGVGRATGVVQNVAGDIARKADLKRLGQTTDKTGQNIDLVLLMNEQIPYLTYRVPSESEIIRLHNYFNLYGYNSGRYGKPNFIERDFNYIKGSQLIFKKGIPSIYKTDIESRYNNGIRFWKKDRFLEIGGKDE